MSRLTRRVRSDVSPMILKLMNLEEVPTECIEVIGTDSKTCDEVCRENQCGSCVLSAVFEKLAHYEDLEEQGRLIELPCAVGDTVWIIRNYRGIKRAQQGTVYEMYFTKEMKLMITVKHIGRGEFGKTVFTNKEEAEAKLAEMEGAE